MKRLTKYILTPILFIMIVSAASAQRYSLYYTRTLYDGIQNPHHRALDSCRAFASNLFFVVPTLNLDLSIDGQLNDVIKSSIASENLSKLSLVNGGNNTITNQFNLNLLMMKFRLSRKREAELGFYGQLKTQTGMSINNGLFNLLTQGNYAYRGKSIDGFLDIGVLSNMYGEAGLTYRQRIYGKLHGGFKVGYILGLVNATVDIKDSKFTTSSNGDTINISVNGIVKSPVSMFAKDTGGKFQFKPSVDPNALVKDMFKNSGLAISAGLQYDLTRKATLSVGLLDFGYIKWNDNSKTYKISKNVQYTGVPALETQSFTDSIMKDITKFDVDSTIGSYTSKLLGRVEISGQYRWANWFHQTVIASKTLDYDYVDLVLINNLRFIKRFNFIVLGTYNTRGYTTIGGQFLYRAKGGGLDLYFGSEKIFNTYQASQQLFVDHTKRPIGSYGADFNFGLNWGFGRCPRKKPVSQAALPADSDGDGILDVIDDCPYAAGPSENKGCPWPDVDKDGVFDKDDACPVTPGPVENKGCPWPDADNDSIPDKDDACPTSAGLKANMGCPDTDGDGLFDNVDSCINTAGPLENKGCPWADTDGDGIFDKDDKCPNVAGALDNNGCPAIPQKVELTVEEQEVINKVFSNLNFESGKSVIAASSFESSKLLNELLVKKPSFKLLIEGHTDNAGKAATNFKLSQSRADAVKQYFVDNGIAADRITAKGYGPSKPIADNKTAAGKAKNRRVEFTILE